MATLHFSEAVQHGSSQGPQPPRAHPLRPAGILYVRGWSFVERFPPAAMVCIEAELFEELGESMEPDLESWIVGMNNPAGTGTCLVSGVEPTLEKKEAPSRGEGA